MINKKYNISLQFGNTQKTILEMDEVDVCYGLSEQDKNDLLWSLIDEIQRKRITKDIK